MNPAWLDQLNGFVNYFPAYSQRPRCQRSKSRMVAVMHLVPLISLLIATACASSSACTSFQRVTHCFTPTTRAHGYELRQVQQPLPIQAPASELERAVLSGDPHWIERLLKELPTQDIARLARQTRLVEVALERGEFIVFERALSALDSYAALPLGHRVAELAARRVNGRVLTLLLHKGWRPLYDGTGLAVLRRAYDRDNQNQKDADAALQLLDLLMDLAEAERGTANQLYASDFADLMLRSSDSSRLARYLDLTGLDLNRGTEDWSPALFHAPAHLPTIQLLLQRGSDIFGSDTRRYSQSASLLHHMAAIDATGEVTQYLLGKGLTPKSAPGVYPPVYHASHAGLLRTVQLLAEAGDDVRFRSAEGQTALSAALGGPALNWKVVEVLVDHGLDPWRDHPVPQPIVTRRGERFIPQGRDIAQQLLGSIPEDHAALMRKVLALKPKSASLDQLDARGWTALHYAAFARNAFATRILLAAGASHKVEIDSPAHARYRSG